MQKTPESWCLLPKEFTQANSAPNDSTYWDGAERESALPAEDGPGRDPITLYSVENFSVETAAEEHGMSKKFFTSALQIYDRFMDNTEDKWHRFKFGLNRLIDYGPHDVYFREMLPKNKKKYLIAGAVGAVALAATYAAHKHYIPETK
jgi:hypothetical protein